VLRMQDEMSRLQRRLDRLQREMHEAIRDVERQYKHELVLYRPPTELERT
jgi:hypothetical protein